MTKRSDLDDAITAEIIDAVTHADYFTVNLFLGSGRYDRHDVVSLDIARQAGALMEDIHRNGRKAMIYAVRKDGKAVFVPADFNPGEASMIALNANHPAAQRQQAKPTLTELARQISTPTPALDPQRDPVKAAADHNAAVFANARSLAIPDDNSIPTFLKRKMPKDMTPEERREHDRARKRATRLRHTEKDTRKAMAEVYKPKPPVLTKPRKPGERARYDWDAAEQKAAKGVVPSAPDFSANTHRYYRPHLDACAKLARAGDLKGLEDYEPKFKLKPYCSSRTPLARYRLLCIRALRVKS